MKRKRFIIFDFDGTLADTSLGIYSAFKKSCIHLGLAPPNIEEFKSCIGPPVDVILQDLFPRLNQSEINTFTRNFRFNYDNNDYQSLIWYPNVISTIQKLSFEFRLPLGIVTNKPTLPTKKILQDASLDKLFEFIIGIDFCSSSNKLRLFSSKSEAISYAISLINDSSFEVTYVGDTLSDLQESNTANIAFIAAQYGFYNWELSPLSCIGISDISQLCSLLYE